uniref:Uncharacterized protein n=1 Tax=Anguilla anguilla TaxID=7936 RepID=A0A0E9Q3P0_ANGAN
MIMGMGFIPLGPADCKWAVGPHSKTQDRDVKNGVEADESQAQTTEKVFQ